MKYIVSFMLIMLALGKPGYAQEHSYVPDASYDEIQDRIDCLNKEMPLHFNQRVKYFVDYFAIRNRDYFSRVVARSDTYFPVFDYYLNKYDLPKELKYLSIVESGLNPMAVSRAGAVGLWQFMPGTGKAFKLNQSWYIDERIDPYKATEKACIYLKQLYQMFDDWSLALAAYNSGPGNVRKAIRRAGGQGSFWDIYKHLPRETRSYVPQFVAVTYLMNYLDYHHFSRPPKTYPIAFDTIEVSGYMHLETFSNLIDVCLDDMILLNPHLVRGAVPEKARSFALRFPSDKYTEVISNRQSLLDSASKVGKEELEMLARNEPGSTFGREKRIYRVRSGDVLGLIAERYHVRVSDLRIWNNIRGSNIRIGQRLKIWVLPAYSSSTKQLYTSNKPKKRTPVKSAYQGSQFHTVKFGDSLWDITKMYEGLTVENLKKWNGLTSNSIKPGQKLIIAL